MPSGKIKSKFVIVCEDEHGQVFAARTWEGDSADGIKAVRTESILGVFARKVVDVWAVPVSSR